MRQLAQLGRGHRGELLKYGVHQNVAAIKQNALIHRSGTVADFFDQHLRRFVIGISAVGAACIAEAGRSHRELATIVPRIGGGLEAVKTVFFENCGVYRVGDGGIVTGSR